MAFIPALNTALVELICLWEDQVCENTLYFQKSGAFSGTDLVDIGNAVRDWWIARVVLYTNVNVSLQEVKVTDLTTDTSPVVTIVSDLPAFGDVTGDPLPNNCSLTVSFRTAGRGRSSRGRNYVIGLSEASVAGNTVDSGYLASIRTAYANLETDVSGAVAVQWVVVSRYHNKAPRTTALVQPVTSAIIVDPFIDSQRRRLPGRGR